MGRDFEPGPESLNERIERLPPEKRKVLEQLLQSKKEALSRVPIQRRMRTVEPIPLSYAQQRLWFLDQLAPGVPIYNIPSAVRFSTPLDKTVLERSINEIIRRHEILRTTFAEADGQPIQKIASSLVVPIAYRDLRTLPSNQRESEAEHLAILEAQQPFDLARGPLIRATLLRLGEADFIFLLMMHHIVTDGWSMRVFFDELAHLYTAFASNQPSRLPELKIQYADFAVWQREWLQGEILEKQLGYWKQQLQDLPVLRLPTDRPRPVVQSFHGAHYTVTFPVTFLPALRALSQQEGVTLFMTLLAAFKTLLHRYTGQDEIVIGSPTAGRNRAEIEGLIGFFVNTLVLRTSLSGNPTFRQYIQRVREVTVGAYAHQDIPFEMLVEKFQLERDLGRNPMFQVMMQLQSSTTQNQPVSGSQQSLMTIKRGTAMFDLAFSLWENANEFVGEFEYNTDLFDAGTIERMAGHFLTLLEGIIADPDQRLSDLPLLRVAERHQLLVEWNITAMSYPRDACIHHLIEDQVERTPEGIAAVFEDQQISYKELNRRANQVANHLLGLGVEIESPVGICMDRSIEMVVAVLGIWKAGGAYVPLDPTYPSERLAFMLRDAQVKLLLTQQRLGEKLREYGGQVICLDTATNGIAEENDQNPNVGLTPDNLAYVIYTSGSTGLPKGALIEHHGLCNVAKAQVRAFGVNSSSRVLQFSSLGFDASAFEIIMALPSGGVLCLGTLDTLRSGPDLIRLIKERRVSIVTLPPSVLAVLPDDDLPDLQTITVAGEACTADVVARWAPGRRFFNLYGPTEATIWATVSECHDAKQKPTIGRPIANTQVYVLDPHLNPVPIGIPGELYIGGAGVARGYLNRPELTTEKFIPNHFSTDPGARLYKTGDLVRYLPDGTLDFLGRFDHQVKLRGFRIELGEIEAALKQHPGVQDAVVVAHEDASGDKRLAAYLVPGTASAPTVAELRIFLKQKLPDFMLPSAFVILDRLPLTPNGKIDRQGLKPPENGWSDLSRGYVAPRTPIEETLARLWSEVLDVEKVGIHDNFFTELGGHSLRATQVISRLRTVLQVELPLRCLFEAPTVAGLAQALVLFQAEQSDRDTVDQVLAKLQNLSEDEAKALLSADQQVTGEDIHD